MRVGDLLRKHGRRLLALFAAVLLPLCVFAALAEDVVEQEAFWWDGAILGWLHSHSNPALDLFMLWVSRIGLWWGLIPFDILAAGWLWVRRRRVQAVFFSLATGGAGLLNEATKHVFGRPRPALWATRVPGGFSFPSGHAMGSTAAVAAVVVLLWQTRARWPVLAGGTAWVLLVSASRAYLGVHYPSDLIAAWMASLGWVLGLAWILRGRLDRT